MTVPRLLSRLTDKMGFSLPKDYMAFCGQRSIDISPWEFMDEWLAIEKMSELKKKYGHDLVPFAYTPNDDDIAAFVAHSTRLTSGNIVIIREYTSRGFELDVEFATFMDWLCSIVEYGAIFEESVQFREQS